MTKCQTRRSLEEVVEGLPGIVWSGLRAGLALHGSACFEEAAGVPLVLWCDACRQRLLVALPPAAGVERHAVNAAVNTDTAPCTAIVRPDRQRQFVTAAGAAEHFVRCHEIGRLGSRRTLQLSARRSLFRRFGPGWRSAAVTIARPFVLISPLTIFAIAHGTSVSDSSNRSHTILRCRGCAGCTLPPGCFSGCSWALAARYRSRSAA